MMAQAQILPACQQPGVPCCQIPGGPLAPATLLCAVDCDSGFIEVNCHDWDKFNGDCVRQVCGPAGSGTVYEKFSSCPINEPEVCQELADMVARIQDTTDRAQAYTNSFVFYYGLNTSSTPQGSSAAIVYTQFILEHPELISVFFGSNNGLSVDKRANVAFLETSRQAAVGDGLDPCPVSDPPSACGGCTPNVDDACSCAYQIQEDDIGRSYTCAAINPLTSKPCC